MKLYLLWKATYRPVRSPGKAARASTAVRVHNQSNLSDRRNHGHSSCYEVVCKRRRTPFVKIWSLQNLCLFHPINHD